MQKAENVGNWKVNGNTDLCTYWMSKTGGHSQIVIMNRKEFYNMYPELDKHGSKSKDFELTITADHGSNSQKRTVGKYPTFDEAYEAAVQVMNENPVRIPFI